MEPPAYEHHKFALLRLNDLVSETQFAQRFHNPWLSCEERVGASLNEEIADALGTELAP
jgi:hypothetical protein